MPPKTYPEICDRLAAVGTEIDTLLSGAADRALTAGERTQCDALEAEAKTLKAGKAEHEADQARRQRAEALRLEIDGMPRLSGTSPAQPTAAIGASKPTVALKPHQGRLTAFGNAEDAYLAGMHMLAAIHAGSRDGIGEAGAHALRFCKDRGMALTAIQYEGENSRGGYLVFPTMEAAIVKLREQYGVARRNFGVKSMTGDTHSWPREEGSHTVYYPEEGGEITASAMKWGQCTLTAKKAAILARMSSELSEDAVVSMADELAENMAWKFSYAEDLNGFVGDGTATYGGMTGIVTKIADAAGVTYAGSIYDAITGNTAFSTLDLADFEAVIGKLPVYAQARAKWYVSKAGWAASMLRLLDAAGGNTAAMLAAGGPVTFLGYPVEFVQVMNSTLTVQASTVLLLLGDLTQCCYLGNRRGIRVDTSTDRYFELDQLAVKASERFGITCVPGDPAAPTTAAGPVIALKTPSA